MAAPQFEFLNYVVPQSSRRFYRTFGKRALDILLVLAIAPAVLPVLAIIVVLTALDGGNPIYRQTRIGRHGRPFSCIKVRTMVPDAEAALSAVLRDNPRLSEEWLRAQKLSRDPRVTWFGRFLRRTSLDELPQLWNVLWGSMSLVGPRPILPEQVPLYDCGRSWRTLLHDAARNIRILANQRTQPQFFRGSRDL